MKKKLLSVLFLYAVQLIDASAIMHEAISYVPGAGSSKANIMHATKKMTKAQWGQWASVYKKYLETGKGDPLLFDMITKETLQHGYTPLGLTAEDVQEIKKLVEITSFSDEETLQLAFPVLPSWFGDTYDNVTSEVFTGIDYKEYKLAPDDCCQGVGEVLAPRLLEDIDGFKTYFYCKKNYFGKQVFVAEQQEKIKSVMAVSQAKHKYHFINDAEIDEISSAATDVVEDESLSFATTDEAGQEDKLIRFKVKNGLIKYLVVLQEDLSPKMINFFKDILEKYPDLVIVIAFKDDVSAIGNDFLTGNVIFRNLIIAGKGLRTVGNNFLHWSNVKSIDMPEGVTQVGDHFLFNCSRLIRVLLSKNLTQVGIFFLAGPNRVESIDIPEGVTRAGSHFLFGCATLIRVTLSKNLVQVGNFFVSFCSRLTRLKLPESLSEVGKYFLKGSNSLERVEMYEVTYEDIRPSLSPDVKSKVKIIDFEDETIGAGAMAAKA